MELDPEKFDDRDYKERYTYKIYRRKSLKKLFSNMKQRYSLRDYKFSLVVLVLAISVIGMLYGQKCKTGAI